MKKLFAAFLLVSSFVVSLPSYALPLGTSNILVSSDNILFEYTPEGQIVQQIPIPLNILESSPQSRDLIVTASGEVAIFNGTIDPELSLYDPQTGQWRSFKFPGWNIANNESVGGIAAYGDGIYVTDMLGGFNGIIRFGLDGTAERVLKGRDYLDLTLGLDGKFYALHSSVGFIDIIDPVSMQIIRTIALGLANIQGVAVNAGGEIYTVSWNGELNKFDSNGTLLNSMLTANPYLSDIDIDAQGQIVFQDRNNVVYLTNEQFDFPQEITLPVNPGALSFVAFSKNDAIVKTNPNILVSSDNRLFEYTTDGQLVFELPIPPIPEALAQARDLIVTKSGEIAFFNGTFDPELSLYNPQSGLWRSFKFPGWSIANNVSNGGIAAFGDYVYVTDMLTDGNGIVRFTFDGTALDGMAQRFMDGQDYIDLTIGLNGKLYALQPNGGLIDIIDPITMQMINSVQLQPANDIRGIAVNQRSEIFAVDWNGDLIKYDANGVMLNPLPIAWNISDVDINAAGKIIFQDRNNNVFIMDEADTNPIVFPLPVPTSALSFVAFAQNDVFGNLTFVDSDNDGIDDNWELQFALDPQDPFDATLDFDGDGLTNLEEFNASTDPWNFDSDNDGLPDGEEVNIYATNPNNRDTDGDGIADSYEVNNQLNPLDAADALLDKDGDGLNNFTEYDLGTSANTLDSDGDGINDGDEVNQGLNPADKDTDNDGLADGKEIALGLNPLQRDSDNNGIIDGFEHGNIIRVNPQQSYSVSGNGKSFGASLSADGRYMVFVSESSSLVSNDTNGVMDAFWSDTLTGEVRRVSVSSGGEEGNDWSGRIVNGFGLDISDDGRFVVFHSSASNLVTNDTNNTTDIFVRDTQTSTTTRVSVTSTGIEANSGSWFPSISADGRYVAFDSNAVNLLPGLDGNAITDNDVFVHDRQTGITSLVSKSSEGTQGNHRSTNAVISGNGRFVAFTSESDNLVANDTNGLTNQYSGRDVFVHDLHTGVTQRVSISTEGVEGNNYSEAASISGDGRYIAFHSLATTLDFNVPVSYNVFVHDRIMKQTNRIAIDDFEGGSYKFRNFPSISQSGRYVALRATHTVYGYNAVFVYDRLTGQTHLASRDNKGTAIQHSVGNDLAIADNGQFVAFSTTQWQLVPDKIDGIEEVFLAKTGFSAELATTPTAVITSVDTDYIFTPIVFDASLSVDPNGELLDYQWDFGDGTFGSGVNVSHVYPVSGNYTVTLSVFDGSNPPTIASKVMTILAGAPIAVLNVPDTIYINSPVTFDASLSTDPNGDPLDFYWEFGDGITIGGPSAIVSHAYATSGTYNMILHVQDGNTETLVNKTITVLTGAPTAILNAPDTVYINAPVPFDALLSTDPNGDPLNYFWDFGDGLTGSGITTNHIYSLSGNYTVTLSVFDGNTSTLATKVITVLRGEPSAVITSSDTVNKNDSLIFDASFSTDPNGDPLSYQWDFGDGQTDIGITTVHVYAVSGSYTVSLTVFDGNTPTIATKVITVVNQVPTAVITSADTVDKNISMLFDASLSSDSNGDPLTYSWDFGDGSLAATSTNVNHTYTKGGSYTVTLTVNDGETSASASKIITVANQAPIVVLNSEDTIDSNTSTVFDASLSTDPNNDALTYQWIFGDGRPMGTGATVNHTYTLSGTYTLTLNVYDGETVTTVSKVLTVINSAPIAVITADDTANKNLDAVFDASLSSDPNSNQLLFHWDFGDGYSYGGINVTHAYKNSGTYTVTLTVSDIENSTSVSKVVTVLNQAPVPVITAPDTINKNSFTLFDAELTTDPNGDVIADSDYVWNFGDGTTVTGIRVSHTYTTSGSYTINLTVSDGESSASTSKVINVLNDSPVAVITGPNSVAKNSILTLDAIQSSDANGDALTYSWNVGDGRPLMTGTSVSYIYSHSGNFTVTLTVSDGETSTTTSKIISVDNQAPTATISSADTVNRNEGALFDSSFSTDSNGDSLTYSWSFGDGTLTLVTTNTSVNHVYASSGTYTVTLTVSDGETSTITSKVITVLNPVPNVVISAASSVNKNASAVYDASLSTDPNGDTLTYFWNFGDGTTATGGTVNHTYASSGNYTLTLTLSDGELSVVGFKVITVLNQAPTAIISSADIMNKNVSSTFDASLSTDSNSDVLSYNWDFGDGVTATGVNVNHAYEISGNYTVTLTANDGESSSTVSKVITVINQAPVANAGVDQVVVQRDTVTLDGSSSNDPDVGDSIVSYQWTQISGREVTLNNINSAVTTFRAPRVRRGAEFRELVFELTVTDEEGVINTDTILIRVNKK